LKASPLLGELSLEASAAGLAKGVYRATVTVQSASRYIEVPIVFVVGASDATQISGVANAASFASAFAPGAQIVVSGSGLAGASQSSGNPPLPLAMSGVSATINGVSAPLFSIAPDQLKIQIPYETGAGMAVLGVNNNGQVDSYTFLVTAAAPGI